MNRWPWPKIVSRIACFTVLLGMAPLAYFYWFGFTHNPHPLLMPLPLKRGEYSSPFFKTDLNESYQIDLEWDGRIDERMHLDMTWRVVDDSGAVIQRGIYKDKLLGNSVTLGDYEPKPGVRQKIVLRNLQDAQGMDSAHPTLEIGVPEIDLEMAYGIAFAVRFAFMVAAPGVLTLLFLLIWRAIRRNTVVARSRT